MMMPDLRRALPPPPGALGLSGPDGPAHPSCSLQDCYIVSHCISTSSQQHRLALLLRKYLHRILQHWHMLMKLAPSCIGYSCFPAQLHSACSVTTLNSDLRHCLCNVACMRPANHTHADTRPTSCNKQLANAQKLMSIANAMVLVQLRTGDVSLQQIEYAF